MPLKLVNEITLPPHVGAGGFDHASYHAKAGRMYVAHTANDALEVIDCETDHHEGSVRGLKGVAGALISEERNLLFTSNRGANSVGIFSPGQLLQPRIVPVGVRPNGLAFDPERGILLAANVGEPGKPESFTISMVNVKSGSVISEISVPGRTRWAIFDPGSSLFFVNVGEPACILGISSADPRRIAKVFEVPAKGPHGLDMDLATRTLFCACDSGDLFALDAGNGSILARAPLAGTPDVIFFNRAMHHLYVTTGDPGVVEVFDTASLKLLETVKTEKGAHTIGYDWDRHKVYSFLPNSCRALVFQDS